MIVDLKAKQEIIEALTRAIARGNVVATGKKVKRLALASNGIDTGYAIGFHEDGVARYYGGNGGVLQHEERWK